MSRTHVVAFFVSMAVFGGGCVQQPFVTSLSDERRIWVVRQGNGNAAEVFRCADGAPVDQPPKPVCVRAPMAEQ